MSGPGGGRAIFVLRLAAALLLLVCAAILMLGLQSHRGPILVALSPSHGVDLADVAVLAPLFAATALVVGVVPRRVVRPSRAVASALVVGLALLTALLGALDLSRTNRRLGPAFDVVGPAAFAVLTLVSVVTTTAGAHPWPTSTQRRFVSVMAVLSAGLAVDLAVLPSGTLFGAAALAGYLASRGSRARVALLVLVAASVLLSAASLADVGGLDVLLARSGGGGARGVAFGVVVVVAYAFVPRWFRVASEADGSTFPSAEECSTLREGDMRP